LALLIVYFITTSEEAAQTFWFVFWQDPTDLSQGEIAFRGMLVTITVAIAAYLLAITIGIIVGLGRVSSNVFFYNIATFYVEIVRGVPILVLLMYIAFVGVPLLIDGMNYLGEGMLAIGLPFGQGLADLTSRDFNNTWRVILGLGIAYGAFSAEIIRAGIESIEKGQMEAARSLGMGYFQAMRLVILPQAVRRVLPALGNDFVAMVKDSSLVSVLGVQDMTQLAKLHAASTFLFFQTYSILAFLYLVLTIMLTRAVRWLERRMGGRH
ncbi:MAG: amino acid ABC transporter permease, partial [Anaerolineales bacterium]|nr:amino acid ABC transporter permease [Anaerolineales bacterium]